MQSVTMYQSLFLFSFPLSWPYLRHPRVRQTALHLLSFTTTLPRSGTPATSEETSRHGRHSHHHPRTSLVYSGHCICPGSTLPPSLNAATSSAGTLDVWNLFQLCGDTGENIPPLLVTKSFGFKQLKENTRLMVA